jgi:hypothetical protein
MANVDDILEQCLQQVLSGQSTVDDCLKEHARHADVLRPLLWTALEIERLDPPEAAAEAFEAGREAMLEALARRERDRAAAQAAPSGPFRRWTDFLRPEGPTGVRLGRLVAIGALGVATVLVWVAAAGLLLRTWSSGLVPVTCVVAEVDGVVQVQTNQDAPWQPLVTGWVLEPGQRIRTGDPSSVTIKYLEGGTTSVGPNAELAIAQLGERRDGKGSVVVLQQLSGSTHNLVESPSGSATLFRIETASASVVVGGTEFKVRVGLDGSTSVIVLDGVVRVTGGEAMVTLSRGRMTMVQVGQAPGPVLLAPPGELTEMPAGGETPDGSQPPPTETSEPEARAEPDASPAQPGATATVGSGDQEPTQQPPAGLETPGSGPTVTPESSPTSEPSAVPSPTPRPPTATPTPRPPTATPTPQPPTATPTSPPPTATPMEVVEIYQAIYRASKEELIVKARTSVPECTLTLVGFGAMVAEGEHWVYVAEDLPAEDVPPTITVQSSCGGWDTSPVQWQ